MKDAQQVISDFLNTLGTGIGYLYSKGKAAELMIELEINGYVIDNEQDYQWQPIDTAPKDGVLVMLYWQGISIHEYPKVGHYEEGLYCNPDAWESAERREYGDNECYPTHWMPLPLSPVLKQLHVQKNLSQ